VSDTTQKQALLYALLDLRAWLRYLNGGELENLAESTKGTIKEIEVLIPKEKLDEINH